MLLEELTGPGIMTLAIKPAKNPKINQTINEIILFIVKFLLSILFNSNPGSKEYFWFKF